MNVQWRGGGTALRPKLPAVTAQAASAAWTPAGDGAARPQLPGGDLGFAAAVRPALRCAAAGEVHAAGWPVGFLYGRAVMGAGRMHADEVATDVALVRRLVGAQFPQWAGLPVEPVDSAGTDNAMYRLGTDLAVRLPRIPGAVGGVAREQQWVPQLAPQLPLAVPVPLGEGEPAAGFPWPWSVCRWLDGANPVAGRIAEPDLLAADLAGFLRALRRIDADGGPPSDRGGPLVARDAATRAAIQQLRGTVDTDAVTAVWEESLRAPQWEGPAVWAHGDLSPGNVLISAERLSAVLDFGGVGVGDPAVDLIAAWNLLPAGVRDGFRAALQVGDASWSRGRGWALSIALIQLPYYRDTNPALAASAQHVISEVLTEHRAGG